MPQALPVDRSEVRAVAVQIGVREAARRFGIKEDTVKAWSMREGWFTAQEATERKIAAIRTEQRVERGLSPVAPTSAEILKSYDGESRLFVAKGLHAGAEAISRMDGQEVVMAAQQVGQTVKSLALVHGWASNVQLSVLTDVLGNSAPELPDDVIDV